MKNGKNDDQNESSSFLGTGRQDEPTPIYDELTATISGTEPDASELKTNSN